jgi:hypothetical protein
MLEVIKNLKPGQRLQAFLFVTIVTSLTSLLTVYLKTDDCKGIGDQYQTLVGNYTELMKINNQIIESNNKKDRDLIVLGDIISGMNEIKPIVKTDTKTSQKVSYNTNDALATIGGDDGNPPLAMSRPESQTITKTVEKTTIINEVPNTQKHLIDSAMHILEKYKKKN